MHLIIHLHYGPYATSPWHAKCLKLVSSGYVGYF